MAESGTSIEIRAIEHGQDNRLNHELYIDDVFQGNGQCSFVQTALRIRD